MPQADSGNDGTQPASPYRQVLQHVAERLSQMLSQPSAVSGPSGQQPARKKARLAEVAVKLQAMSAPMIPDNDTCASPGMHLVELVIKCTGAADMAGCNACDEINRVCPWLSGSEHARLCCQVLLKGHLPGASSLHLWCQLSGGDKSCTAVLKCSCTTSATTLLAEWWLVTLRAQVRAPSIRSSQNMLFVDRCWHACRC